MNPRNLLNFFSSKVTLFYTNLLVGLLVSTQLSADQVLVSGFTSDSVGRYNAANGAFIENFEMAGLDGTLAARVGGDGLLYVASEGSNQIKRYNIRTGGFVDNFVNPGFGLNGPSGISWDQNGDLIVASFNNDSILRYDGSTGAYMDTIVTTGSGGLNGPDNGMIVGPDGFLYVPSYFSNQILRYDLNDGTSEVFISGIGRPRVLVFEDEHLYITSETADAVRRYQLDGTFVDNFIQPGSSILDVPVGLEYFNGSWLVSSVSTDKVLQFDSNGQLLNADFISAGSGGLDGPVFITGISSVPEPRYLIPIVILFAMMTLMHRRRFASSVPKTNNM